MKWHSRTLQRRLVWRTSLATGVILLLCGAVVYVFVRMWLETEFNRSLESSTRALAALVEEDGDQVKLEPEAAFLPEFSRPHAADYYVVWLADGTAVAASDSLRGRKLEHGMPVLNRLEMENVRLPDGKHGRQAAFTFNPRHEEADGQSSPGKRVATIVVARHTADMRTKLAALAWLLLATGVLATVGSGWVMAVAVRRGLAPLNELAGTVSQVAREDLRDRVALADAPGEMLPVIGRLNEMLERIERTIERERRFTSDVAHELRTPLAGLEVILDVSAARRRTAEEYERSIERCTRIVRSMHAMVEKLLLLARSDARQVPVNRERVAVGPLIDDVWSLVAEGAVAKQMAARFDVAPELGVESDPDLLGIVLNVVFDNAVKHGARGSEIAVRGEAVDGEARVEVSNGGCQIDQAEATRVFDRFWRGDRARSGNGEHTGLGLSLAKEIVELLGGRIEAWVKDGEVFTVRLTLPGATAMAGALVTSGGQT